MTTFTKNYTVLDSTSEADGTSLQGYIACSYSLLVELFGTPTKGDGYKTQVEWVVKTDDGVLFTIYDWKETVDPLNITEWHIGGNSIKAIEAVHDIVNQKYEERSSYVARFKTLRYF